LKFITEPQNLALMAIATAAGILLMMTSLKRGGGGSAAVSAAEATQLMNHKNAVVVDVRSAEEFAAGSVIGARHVPLEALAARMGELARFKGRPLIVVCQSGTRSAKAVPQLSKEGFTEVYNLAGGIGAWKTAGLPLAKAREGTSNSNRKDKA